MKAGFHVSVKKTPFILHKNKADSRKASSKRSSGSSTSFDFLLSRPVKNVYRIDLLFASLNNTFYTFKKTDIFVWHEIFFDRSVGVIDPVTGIVDYSLPPVRKEFYFTDSSLSVDEFVDYIENQMNALSDSLKKDYKVSYDQSTFKLVVENTENDNRQKAFEKRQLLSQIEGLEAHNEEL